MNKEFIFRLATPADFDALFEIYMDKESFKEIFADL